MADLREEIDIEQEAKDFKGGFTLLSPGWKTFRYIEDSLEPTKSGKGHKLVISLECSNGVTMKHSINVINESVTAQAIGKKELSKIAECIGHKGKLRQTEVLYGREFDALVAVTKFKSNTTGEMLDSNDLTDFKPKGEGASVVPEASNDKEESVGW